MLEQIPALYPYLIGALTGVVGLQAYIAFKKDDRARTLKGMVKAAAKLASGTEGSDAVEAAKKAAEEMALIDQLQAAVAKLGK